MKSFSSTIKCGGRISFARLQRTLFTVILGIGFLTALAFETRLAHAQTAPTITSANSAIVAENQTSAIDVNATDDSDSEGNGLTFSLSGGADQALFNIDAIIGVVTFKNEPDFERPADQGTDNIYDLQVAVTDTDNLTTVQDIVITILDLTCSASSLNAPTEAVFNAALDCYKELSTGSFSINVTSSFALTSSPVTVSNHNGVVLTISGGGNTINGAGSYTPIQVLAGTITIDNIMLQNGFGGNGGAVHIASGADVTITNTIIQSSTATTGGGIWNAGTAKVSDSTVADSSSNSGGGIRNDGTLTVDNTLFSGNSTSRSGEGGGLSNYGTAHFNNSAAIGNSGAFGAALYTRGVLTVSNSTLSDNAASSLAGGIYIFWSGTTNVYNTTISNSSAKVGGSVLNNGGTLNMFNSIIANTTNGGNCYGTIGGSNSLSDDTSCSNMTLSSTINLAALADKGCNTTHTTTNGPACLQVHAPDVGSAAIDAGDNTICAASPVNNRDQRGIIRPQNNTCEIGAVELVVENDDWMCFPTMTPDGIVVMICM